MIVQPRRKTNDPEGTRKRILDAAARLFTERGYAGTSLGEVAEAAGVQTSLIPYHYESKERLWSETCNALAQPMLELAESMVSGTTRPDLMELLERRFRLMQDSPHLQKLILWMGMGQAPMPTGPRQVIPKMLEAFSRTMQSQPDDLRRTFMLIVAAMDGWFLHRRALATIAAPDADPNELDEAFLAYLLKIARDEVTILRETQ
ncbi:MAG: TetR/AcrR family transcriptional regulator [Fimbriimonadaceae bacterium]|nr:TetR/AcrR family transcriptional regulator [Fimbriimonadaceae bacterium]